MNNEPFLDHEATEIVRRLTNSTFVADSSMWLYFLLRIELIPGCWCCRIELENSDYVWHGSGGPSEAVKQAFDKIPKDWLEEGLRKGSEARKTWFVEEDDGYEVSDSDDW